MENPIKMDGGTPRKTSGFHPQWLPTWPLRISARSAMVCRVHEKKHIEVMELHWFTRSGDLQLSFFFTMPTKVSATPQRRKNLVLKKLRRGYSIPNLPLSNIRLVLNKLMNCCRRSPRELDFWQEICLDMGQAWDTDSANWTVCYAKLPI